MALSVVRESAGAGIENPQCNTSHDAARRRPQPVTGPTSGSMRPAAPGLRPYFPAASDLASCLAIGSISFVM